MKSEVLILGGNHQNPLGIIEALAQKGLMSNVIILSDSKSSFVLKSKFVKQGWICKKCDEMLEIMLSHFSRLPLKTVVYACNDNTAAFISRNYTKLKDYFYLPGIPGDHALLSWMDKEYMAEVARQLYIDSPKEWVVSKDEIPDDITFPCVTKSLTSVNKGKSEFSLCHNLTELETFFRQYSHSDKIQLQKFIDKEFEYQFLGLSLNGGNEIIIPGRTHINKTSNFNNLTFLKYQADTRVADNDILPKVKAFIKASGYSGLFSAEFMHGKDGKDYFLEVNFRNDGNGIAATVSGVNLPYIWYLYCTEGDYRCEIQKSRVTETYCMPEDSYFMSMLSGDISFREWRNNLRKANCYVTYFKGDSAPFWSLLWLQKRSLIILSVKYFLRKLHLLRK